MESMLQTLSLNELLMLLEKLLPYEGFGEVEVQDRRESRQKSKEGGFELKCRTRVGNQSGLVLVKVVAEHPLRSRMLHELTGNVLQHDAVLGLAISPFHRSRSKHFLQAAAPKQRVRVIDGPALAELMLRSNIGVRPKGDVDYQFFTRLRAASQMVLETIATMKEAYR
jgi:hypothetical protein